ncbi:MAG: pyocin knob domain-containing protein [Clostridia bacterium]
MPMLDFGYVMGASGYSPTAKVERDGDSVKITITDVNGTSTETIKNMATMGNKTALPVNASLDDYQAEGMYSCKNDELCATMYNAPMRISFFMEVWNPTGTNAGVVQKLTARDGAQYTRAYLLGSGWSAWKQLYAAATAEELRAALGISEAVLDERYRAVAATGKAGIMSADDKAALDKLALALVLGVGTLDIGGRKLTNAVIPYGSTDVKQALDELAKRVEKAENGKAEAKSWNATLAVAGWSAAAPYVQTVEVAGVTQSMAAFVDLVVSDDAATAKAELEAWGLVGRAVTGASTISVTCYEAVPLVALQLRIVNIA